MVRRYLICLNRSITIHLVVHKQTVGHLERPFQLKVVLLVECVFAFEGSTRTKQLSRSTVPVVVLRSDTASLFVSAFNHVLCCYTWICY